ncbi:MAG TPA: hypothetical protein VIJ64_01995 [Candidatus Lustribacter sp.]
MRAPLRAALCAAIAALALLGATPAPKSSPYRIDVTKIQSKALLPKVPLHTEYVVAVNKLGQVTHVISGKTSKDKTYNLQTYGNAMQAFIRTADGKAIAGRYRLTYDYSPKTTRVHREVQLVKAGGVDANAAGAVTKMIDDVHKHGNAPAGKAAMTPGPQPGGNLHLPDLKQILKTPPP